MCALMVSSPLPSPGHQLVRPAGAASPMPAAKSRTAATTNGTSARIAAPTVPRRHVPDQPAGCSVLRCVTAIAAPTSAAQAAITNDSRQPAEPAIAPAMALPAAIPTTSAVIGHV